MSKEFLCEDYPDRPIAIIITDGFISFQLPLERDREIYWILKQEWTDGDLIKKGFIWSRVMSQKLWYTAEMNEFIEANLN